MKYLATIVLVLVAAVGCTTCPSKGEAFQKVTAENARAWERIRTYIALTDQGDTDLDGATSQVWLKRSQAWLANALMLDAAARGVELTYADAYKRAGELSLP